MLIRFFVEWEIVLFNIVFVVHLIILEKAISDEFKYLVFISNIF